MKRKNAYGEASSSSKRNSKVCGNKQEEVQIDRISNLPDSVLAHILSFLPTQDAVKTVLLRRFGLLWATSDNLHFDVRSFQKNYYQEYTKRFINFVRHVLILQDCKPIYGFHLKIDFMMSYSGRECFLQDSGSQKLIKREMRLASEINSWTCFEIKREVKVLDLDFLGLGHHIDDVERLCKIPDFVFNRDSVRELKLVFCRVEPKGQILMRSLKTLFLKYVALNGNEIDEILSGLPLLESLSLIECYNLFKLNFVPPNLKYLKFVGRWCDSRLEISGPNITSLDISGSIEQEYLKDLCSLKDATLGFGYRCWGEDQFHEVRKTLDNLNHAKVLTIYEERILGWFVWASIKISFPPMTWKHIILSTKLTQWYLPGVANMLRASPCLEILDIHINSPDFFVVDSGFFGRELNFENYWNKHEESFQGLVNNLRTVRIHGWVTHPDVPPLVQFLLKNSMGLEKMVITYKRSNDSNQESYFTPDKLLKRSQKLLKLSQKLLSFPRASSSAVILFS